MKSYSIPVTTTAQYVVLGEISPNIKLVWFVFHGYGMQTKDFIKEFECISDDQTVIVAPEGMHRFYRRSTQGEIGASWMTSDLRDSDIANNISYLNDVLKDLRKNGLSEDVKIAVLGFSQGCPTAFRWVSRLTEPVSTIIAWGSDIPKDVYENNKLLQKINGSRVRLVVGESDKYVSSDKLDEIIIELHNQGVQFDFHSFSGGHKIHEDTVRYFHARILDEQLEY